MFYLSTVTEHINRSQAQVSLIVAYSYIKNDITIRLVLVNKSLSAQCAFGNMTVKITERPYIVHKNK